jgi:hypothetical protein
VLGDGDPAPPQDQEWYRRAVAEPIVGVAVRSVVAGAGEIVRRVAPLDLAVRTAAADDPDAARFLTRNEQLRVDGYRRMIEFPVRSHHCEPDSSRTARRTCCCSS